MAKLTPWFPPRVKPVHVGQYQTATRLESHPEHFLVSAKWDGKEWWFVHEFVGPLYNQEVYWRGLARKPK